MPEYRVPIQGALIIDEVSPAAASRCALQWSGTFGRQVREQDPAKKIRGGNMDTDIRAISEITGQIDLTNAEIDEEAYWEQEYADFEETSLKDAAFWRTPVHFLRGTVMFEIFERFSKAFPDHPDDRNTVFYLFKSTERYRVVLRCTHFEHTSSRDLRALARLMDFAEGKINNGGALLDMIYGETVQVEFFNPRADVVELLQQKATRTVLDPRIP